MRQEKITILGIGSPFGDDSLGWKTIELLKSYPFIQQEPTIQLIACDRPGTNWLNLMQGVETVILIDAVKTGKTLGTCHIFSQDDIIQHYASLSTHGIGIGYALQLGKTLGLLPATLTLYGIEVCEISQEKYLSPTVEKAVQQLIELYIIPRLSKLLKR